MKTFCGYSLAAHRKCTLSGATTMIITATSNRKNPHELQHVKIYLNPFMPNGFFYLNSLDQSISKRKDVRLFLKMPRKPASDNVVCLCHLLNILANFSNSFSAYRQTAWIQIRLLLEEQCDLDPHCLQK